MNTERMREMENYKNLERVVLALLEMDAPVTNTVTSEQVTHYAYIWHTLLVPD